MAEKDPLRKALDDMAEAAASMDTDAGEPWTLRKELLSHTSGMLIGLWALMMLAMLLTAYWSVRTQAHERCIEALKDPGVSDVVRMSICTK